MSSTTVSTVQGLLFLQALCSCLERACLSNTVVLQCYKPCRSQTCRSVSGRSVLYCCTARCAELHSHYSCDHIGRASSSIQSKSVQKSRAAHCTPCASRVKYRCGHTNTEQERWAGDRLFCQAQLYRPCRAFCSCKPCVLVAAYGLLIHLSGQSSIDK